MTNVATKLASRLERLESHLAIVLSVHLFVKHLLDRLIDEKSLIATRIRRDHRTYTFAVKLALVFPMGLLGKGLFDNLAALNSLLQIRDVTFGWLHDVAEQHGVGA